MKRLQWHMQQAIHALGLPGLAGAGLLIIGLMVQLVIVQPHRSEVAQLQSSLLAQHKLAQQSPTDGAQAPQAQLDKFYALFPPRSTLSEQLRLLHEVADEQQVDMGQVDYKLSKVSGTPLMRYQISYTVLTDYPALRQYLAQVLLKLPNAALEAVELKRFNEEAEVPETTLNIALYFRQGA